MESILAKFKDPKWGAARLAELSIFKRFSESELIKLYSLGKFVLIRPQSHAVIEGEPTRGLYLILDGTVSIYKTDPENQSLARLAVLESGTHFGELSLFDNAPRSATVIAETSAQCFLLEADDFSRYLDEMGENLQLRFYKTCSEELSIRLRNLNSDYISSQNVLWRYAFRHEK
jgi:CRP-like cAMP-binding protein